MTRQLRYKYSSRQLFELKILIIVDREKSTQRFAVRSTSLIIKHDPSSDLKSTPFIAITPFAHRLNVFTYLQPFFLLH